MDAFGVLSKLLSDYRSFVSGLLKIKDPYVKAKVETEIENGLLWAEPWQALNPAFEPGGTVSELVDFVVLHPANRDVFRSRTDDDPFGRGIAFYRHRTDAFANRRESYVQTTGTRSGKSMAHIVPIVDRVRWEGSSKGCCPQIRGALSR